MQGRVTGLVGSSQMAFSFHDRRNSMSFGLAGLAILLRIASDWLFPGGGPLPYQMLQAVLLIAALGVLHPNLDGVFLRGGRVRRHPGRSISASL